MAAIAVKSFHLCGVCAQKAPWPGGDPQSREACEDFLAAIVFFADEKMSQNRL
jgi:hypothetical protein